MNETCTGKRTPGGEAAGASDRSPSSSSTYRITYHLGFHGHHMDVPMGTTASDLLRAIVNRHGDLGHIIRFDVNYRPVADMDQVIKPGRGERAPDVRIKSRAYGDALGSDDRALSSVSPDPSLSSPLRPLIVVSLPDITGSVPGEGPMGMLSPVPTVVPTVDAVEVVHHEPGFGYLVKLVGRRRRCTWGFGPTSPQSFFFLDTRSGRMLPLECHQSERVVGALVAYGAILGQFVTRYREPDLGQWRLTWSPASLPALSGDDTDRCIVCAARPPDGWWLCGALHGNTCGLCAVRVKGCHLCRDAAARYIPADRVMVDLERPATVTETPPAEPDRTHMDTDTAPQ